MYAFQVSNQNIMASSDEPDSRSKNPAMQPSSPLSSEYAFQGTSPAWPARSPSIQFVSNVVVGDGDAVAASLSACPSSTASSSRGSSSDIEIQVLFQGGDDDDGSTTTSPAAAWSRSTSFRGCSDGELDVEAGRSRLLRAHSSVRSVEEFIERDCTGELRWSALEGGLQFASRSRSNAG